MGGAVGVADDVGGAAGTVDVVVGSADETSLTPFTGRQTDGSTASQTGRLTAILSAAGFTRMNGPSGSSGRAMSGGTAGSAPAGAPRPRPANAAMNPTNSRTATGTGRLDLLISTSGQNEDPALFRPTWVLDGPSVVLEQRCVRLTDLPPAERVTQLVASDRPERLALQPGALLGPKAGHLIGAAVEAREGGLAFRRTSEGGDVDLREELVEGRAWPAAAEESDGLVLGDEVIDMLNAMSQGNDGSMCTIHSNSSDGVFRRIETYAIQAPERLDFATTSALIGGAVDLIVFISQRSEHGRLKRRVSSIREVAESGEAAASPEIFGKPDANTGLAVPLRQPTRWPDLVKQGAPADLFQRRRG